MGEMFPLYCFLVAIRSDDYVVIGFWLWKSGFGDEIVECDAAVGFDGSWLCIGLDEFIGEYLVVDGDGLCVGGVGVDIE